jgi:hypothetical protein
VPVRGLVEWLGFQLVWLAAAFGAARETALPGMLSGAIFTVTVLLASPSVRPTMLTVLASGAIGTLGETALAASGLVAYAAATPAVLAAPAWLVALWLAFGATLGSLAPLLARRPPAAAALLGLIAGPLAYWAGARIGALAVAPLPLAWLAIAVLWGAALPALIHLHRRLAAREASSRPPPVH